MSKILQAVNALPHAHALKEVYIKIAWHQPGNSPHLGTILIVVAGAATIAAVAWAIAWCTRPRYR